MPALLYLLAVAVFAQGTSEFVLAGLLPDVAHDLGVPVGHAGLLTSAFAGGMVVGAPVMAVLGRRLPPRWSLAGFLALFALAHVVGALTPSFEVLLATRVVAAVANAGFLAVTLSTVAVLAGPQRQGRALSVVLAGTTLALVAGVPLGAVVGAGLGWRWTLGAIAVVTVPPLVAIVLSAPRRTLGRRRTGVADELAVLRDRRVLHPLLLAVLVNGATFGAFTFLAVVAEDGGTDPGLVPVLLGVFGVGAFAGVVVAGRSADRHGARVVAIGAPVLAATWGLLALAESSAPLLWTLTPVAALGSFAVGSTLVARIVTRASAAPTMSGSYATSALNLGAVAGPVAAGSALASSGARGPFVVACALVVSAVLAALGGRRGTRTPDRPGVNRKL